jgi:purine-binding chemotaxis protein CheW
MKDKNKFAKESIVEDYLIDLLTESQSELNFNKAATQMLLEQSVNNFLTPMVDPEGINLKTQPQVIEQDGKEIQVEVEIETNKTEISAPIILQDSLDERFQALFFEVAGLTLLNWVEYMK